MTTIFTRIIDGEIPARFVWVDDDCVAFTDVRPLHRGHVLVVPRAEIDHWVDLPPDLAAHLMRVAHAIGRAQNEAFGASRIGLMIAGFEVPHTHLHVVPVDTMADLDFARADTSPDPADLDAVAHTLRRILTEHGHGAHVPA